MQGMHLFIFTPRSRGGAGVHLKSVYLRAAPEPRSARGEALGLGRSAFGQGAWESKAQAMLVRGQAQLRLLLG